MPTIASINQKVVEALIAKNQKIQVDSVGYFLENYIVEGGVVTKNATNNGQIDVTKIYANINQVVTTYAETNFSTTSPNATYYLDFTKDGEYSWATSHASGVAGTDYIAVAEVTTDADGNVNVITDKRGNVNEFRLKPGFTYPEVTDLAGSGRTTETVKGNAASIAALQAETMKALDVEAGYGAKGDGATDDTAAFTTAINALPNGGIIFIPASANPYLVNFRSLPATVQNIVFIGTKGTTIKITGVQSLDTPSTAFTNCKFSNITFTCPTLVTGDSAFTKTSSYLTFEDCTIQDFANQFCMFPDSHVRFLNCKWRSSAGFTAMNGMIGNVTKDFWVENCDFNYVPNNAGGVNAVIALNYEAGLQGNIWILNNKFFDQNEAGMFCDTAIDMEPFTTSQLENVHIAGNVFYNSKVFVSSAKNIFIHHNVFRTTSVLSGNTVDDNMLNIKTTNSTADCGLILIESNDFIEDDGAYDYQAQPINVEPSGNIDTLIIRNNRIQVNGKATGSSFSNPWVAIAVNTDFMTLGMGISKVNILDNIILYTDVPTTKPPAISLNAEKGTIYHVKIRGNRLEGASSCKSFVSVSFGAGVPGLSTLDVQLNDVSQAGTFSVGFADGFNTPTTCLIMNNIGYNPTGYILFSPGIPASGTAQANNNPFPVMVAVSGGTVTNIAKNGVNTGLTSGTIILYPKETITLEYSAAPGWVWYGM